MINNEPVTISSTFCHSGQVSLRHNTRAFIAENVDRDRVKDDVMLHAYEPLEDAYHRLFDEALEKYNEKLRNAQKPGRQIPDYLEKIKAESVKKNGRKPFYEAVFQIGKQENFGVADFPENAELAKQISIEFYSSFAARNQNLYVLGAVIHMDESTPHMHIDFIPVAHGYKKSLETQPGLNEALHQQGIPKAESKTHTERSIWLQSERAALEQIANAHGLEIDHLQTEPRATLSVADYKRRRMQEDRDAAEAERDQALQETAALQDTLQQTEAALENLNRKVTEAEQNTEAVEENLQKLLDSTARAAAEAVYDTLESRTAGRIRAGIQEKFRSFIDWLTGQDAEAALEEAYPTLLQKQKKKMQNILGWFAERVEKRLLNSINRLFSRKEYRADPAVRETEIDSAVAAAKKQIKLEYQKTGERTVPVRAVPVWQPPAPQQKQETAGPEEEIRQQEVKKEKPARKKSRGMER